MNKLNKQITIQGRIFIVFSLIITLTSLVLPRPSERIEQVVLALLILLLGVPHGALDTAFAQRFYKVKGIGGWIAFSTVYLLLSFLVVGLWILAPLLYLIFFLLISLVHFSSDPAEGTHLFSRFFYGGAILVLPSLRHNIEVSWLFGFLVGADAANLIVAGMNFLCIPWLTGLIIATFYESISTKKRSGWFSPPKITALEFLAVGIIALFAPPLVAFTVFFCAMHSVRHVLRTVAWTGQKPSIIFLMGLIPMLGVLLATLVGWQLLGDRPLSDIGSPQLIQILFVGLAALTVPHMVLVHGTGNGART